MVALLALDQAIKVRILVSQVCLLIDDFAKSKPVRALSLETWICFKVALGQPSFKVLYINF